MSQLGLFCTVARTELKEKEPSVSDNTLRYLNEAVKNAYKLGLGRAKEHVTEPKTLEAIDREISAVRMHCEVCDSYHKGPSCIRT